MPVFFEVELSFLQREVSALQIPDLQLSALHSGNLTNCITGEAESNKLKCQLFKL